MEARGITILRGSVGKDHIHLLLSYPPSMAPSKILQYLKGALRDYYRMNFPNSRKSLGDAIIGKRILLCNGWDCNERDNKKLYCKSVQ
ncbi:transposase [Lederbergia citrea]|uniref:transposase n=1 Tax=Lederbergia citrea TaxID=2833581 RepID=UPI003D2BEEC9